MSEEGAKLVTDVSIAAGVFSMPAWAHDLGIWMSFFLTTATLGLVSLRLGILIHDLIKRLRGAQQCDDD